MSSLDARVQALHANIATLEKRVLELESAKRNAAILSTAAAVVVAKTIDATEPVKLVVGAKPSEEISVKQKAPAEADKTEKKKNDKPKKPAPAPAKKGFGEDRGAVEIDSAALPYEHNSFLPANNVDAETNYQNSNTNTEADVANAYNDNERRLRGLAREQGITSAVFFRAPSNYYSLTLKERATMLNAPSIHYLCKTMVMQNTKCPHEEYSDPKNSRYYMVIVQYTARLHNERLGQVIRSLSTPPPSRNAFNFRVCPPEVNDELTGFSHNGVTPLGTRRNVPIILSDRIAKLENGFFWLGGGEPDVKIRFSVKEFIAHFNPIIGNITYDGTNEEE